ncbi:carboxypeptidase-like regulatory domain-containing protein [Methylomonas sp. HW2-6]|uniref:carboxypeptidase-like regulatory domain-containing protein n=1 Tax=Methylomonas sp. HW2-6 TaxID=3376687 RepID=UPI004042D919
MSVIQRLQVLLMGRTVAQSRAYFSTPIKPLFPIAAFFMLFFLSLQFPETAEAATGSWETVSASQVSVKLATPVRNRRSNDATVGVSLQNTSGGEIAGPLRLVITGLAPAGKVSISNASGTTDAGEPYFDLTGYVGGNFTAGGSGLVTVIVAGGGPNTFSFSTRVEKAVAQALKVQIISPATLLTVGHTPQTVKGTVSDPAAQITLNGAPVTNNNGSFQADVSLDEGHNTITARAVNAKGEDVSDAISLSLDMTPPYLTVESPKNGDTVRTDKIAVSGLINDIVRGTVAEGQANVKVNGVAASIANRSYLAENVALNVGENTIKIDAADNVGNTSSISIKVTYQPLAPQHIELFGGQDQTAKINAALAQPLKVKLLDSANKPVANKPVIYRVTEGDGVLSVGNSDQGQGVLVQTDAQGVASTTFKTGSRAGTGNQRVRATSVGFDGEVLFYASATVGAGNKVTVNSGNNQRGAVSQPLPLPFVVAVVDDGANVVPGAKIEFKVTQGGGKFQNGQTAITSTTDSDGRATAEFTLGSEEGLDVHRVSATLVGTELYAGFTASALKTGNPGQTSISGVVLDNQEHPLPKVTVRVDGTTREAQSDDKGQFKITEVPIGAVRLIADGSTTTAEGEWPTLAFNLVTIAGADNPLSAPIYLVKLDTVNAKIVGDQDVTLTLPEVPGFALEVKKGSVTFPDGKKTGKLSVTPVNASKIPMAPPNGMQPQFIVTIQPVGAKFDPPARLTLPNVDGHKPGAQVEMYSYDHDLEEFVAIGLGTVAADGSVIKSNEGVGVIKAGWHCGSQPGGSGCASSPGECQKCVGNCQIVPDDSKTPTSIKDVPEDCKKPGCKGGSPTQVPNDSDVSKNDIKGDCKKPGCENGSAKDQKDDADITKEDAKCGSCMDMAIKPDPAKDKAKCGDGSEKQNCFECKDGRCGMPECPVDEGNDQIFRFSESNLGKVKDFADKAQNVLKKIPYLNINGVKVEARGEVATGKRCCKDCRMTNPVSRYERVNILGYVEITATLSQAPKLSFDETLAYKGYGIHVFGDGKWGIWADVSLTGSAGGYGEYLFDCIDAEGCVALTGGANISIKPTIGLDIKSIGADVLLAGTPKQIIDVGVTATAAARLGQSGFQGNLPIYGNNCPTFCGYTLAAFTGEAKVGVRISLFGYELLNPPQFTYVIIIYPGQDGSC